MSAELEASYALCQRQLGAGQWTAALETAISVRAKFVGSADAAVKTQVARSRLLQAQALVGLGLQDEAGSIYRELMFSDDPALADIVLEARYMQTLQGSDFAQRLRGLEEVFAADDVDRDHAGIRRIQAKAGSRLADLKFKVHSEGDGYEEDIDSQSGIEDISAICTAMLERFADDQDADILVSVNETICTHVLALDWEGTDEAADVAENQLAQQWGR